MPTSEPMPPIFTVHNLLTKQQARPTATSLKTDKRLKKLGNNNITGKLALFSARRRWTVVGIWAAVLIASFFLASGIGDVTGDTSSADTNLESGIARNLIDERIVKDDSAEEFVVVQFHNGTASERTNREFIEELSADLRAVDEIAEVTSYVDGVEGLLSADGKIALVMTTLTVSEADSVEFIGPVLDVIEEANTTAGFSVATVGTGSVNHEFETVAEETLRKGESIGIMFALVVLLIVFGAGVAAGLPILLAIVGIVVAVALSAVVGRVMDLDQFVIQIITMIGLAVGIDYALFIVKRFGEELRAGKSKIDAITTAGNTAGKTVMVSGCAVMIALAGLLIIPDTTFRSFGLGAILVVIAAVAAAITLLPAVVSILGHRVFWLRIPFISRKVEESEQQHSEGGVWDKITDAVTAKPVLSVVLTVGALLGVSAAVLSINLGTAGISSLPDDSLTREAFEILTTEFSDGVVKSTIVIDADATDPRVAMAVEQLLADVSGDSFYGQSEVTIAPNNDLIVIDAALLGDYNSNEAEEALSRLRDDYIPARFGGVAEVYVAGGTAETVDAVNMIADWLPIVFGLVLTSSFLLLLIVFRSIVVPIKAVLMNVLSVSAAYGLLVLVFQGGFGADLFGFQESDTIEFWLPLFLFSVLFGLSMDYHVFLLSRIKEHYDLTGNNRASVAFGLRSTAGIITGAALIMVGVFGGFALGDFGMFQQMGFGLAAAVIIDATLIRSVLVPASMVLLGDKNWYFPSWLEWLPRFDVEGESSQSQPVAGAIAPSGAAE